MMNWEDNKTFIFKVASFLFHFRLLNHLKLFNQPLQIDGTKYHLNRNNSFLWDTAFDFLKSEYAYNNAIFISYLLYTYISFYFLHDKMLKKIQSLLSNFLVRNLVECSGLLGRLWTYKYLHFLTKSPQLIMPKSFLCSNKVKFDVKLTFNAWIFNKQKICIMQNSNTFFCSWGSTN